ncbi:hypothetical protein JKP88DRAFT_287031 [Tribonema minus]|uniref:Uncharacterized protein n=1 Tax=Tribonema minus TaxID=303371 RepID=A0A835Z850_9STRA|nr:hypothetical protein JKP88DRAFT_287031 [Tribonema minus]
MPKKRPKRELTATEIEERRKDVADKRKKKKEDTSVSNYRNRLIHAFGERVVQKLDKDGVVQGLYSESQDQEELFLRAFDRMRNKHFVPRHRVVSIGLRTVLKDTALKYDILCKMNELVEYFSKVRVYASLFSNFVVISCLDSTTPLPQIDSAFSRDCFGVFCYPTRQNPLSEYMERFTSLTGLPAFPAPPFTKEVKNDQATKLWTATKTRMEVHYQSRVKGISNWVLRSLIRPHHTDITDKAFSAKIHKLVTFIDTCASSEGVDAKLEELGFDKPPYVDAVKTFAERAKKQTTVTNQIQHWYDLQKEYVDEPRRRFELMVRIAIKMYPGKDKPNKTARSTYLKAQLIGKAPPKILAPLPMASPKAAFIRIDKSTMKALFPSLDIQMGPWGYSAFLDPYSKLANIRCLRNSTWGRSKRGMMAATGNQDMTECPWLVAPTFETDGHQMKLCLLTSDATNGGAPGVRYLNDAGYKLRTKNVPLQTILDLGRGVYNDTGIIYGRREAVDDVYIGGIDPGIIKPINCIYGTGAAWRDMKGALTHDTAFEYVVVTEDDIKQMYNRGRSSHNEAVMRSRTPYGQALKTLWKYRKKSSRLQDIIAYCRTWRSVESLYWAEILKKVRKVRRFERFRNIQTQVQNIRKKITTHLQGRRGLLVFGNGSFKAKKGHISVPRKQIVRALAIECAVVMGDEYGSSKYSPLCEHELVNLDNGEGRRPRVCSIPLCRTDTFDRDDGGVGGIVKTFLSRFGAGSCRRRRVEQDDGYSTEEESSDVELW